MRNGSSQHVRREARVVCAVADPIIPLHGASAEPVKLSTLFLAHKLKMFTGPHMGSPGYSLAVLV